MTLEELQTQLKQTEIELEEARAHLYRCDGAIQMLRHLILQHTLIEPSPTVATAHTTNESGEVG